jgi:hypothetical protein
MVEVNIIIMNVRMYVLFMYGWMDETLRMINTKTTGLNKL